MKSNTKSIYKKTEIGMIPEDWEVDVLSEHIEIIGGGTPKTTNDEYWNGEIPWISVVDFVGDQRWIRDTEKYITRKGLEHSSTNLLHKGQLIISARGTVGELGQVTKDMSFNQSCYGLDGKSGLDNDFLYYMLRQRVKEFQQKGHGAVFNTITRETFNQILIPIPSIHEQQEIARILSDFDLKICLNGKTNKALEAVGEAVFRRWFVDFDFPDEEGKPYKSSGGKMVYNDELEKEIPKGWSIGKIYEICDVIYGYPFSSKLFNRNKIGTPLIRIRDLKTLNPEFYTTEKDSRVTLVNPGDVVAGMDAEFIPYIWLGAPSYLNQRLCMFKPNKSSIHEFFVYQTVKPLLKKEEKAKVGTTVIHLAKRDIERWRILVPCENLLKTFYQLIAPIVERVVLNSLEIRTLSQIRDSLLPKLMSGKIRVHPTEGNVEVC